MCACLGLGAAIVEPAGFPTSDRHFRRAGLDYLDTLEVARHPSFAAFEEWREAEGRRLVLITTHAEIPHHELAFRDNDVLMVGRESAGVPALVQEAADARVVVSMKPAFRSLNVAVAAAIVVGEAMRQTGGLAGR